MWKTEYKVHTGVLSYLGAQLRAGYFDPRQGTGRQKVGVGDGGGGGERKKKKKERTKEKTTHG